MTVNCGSDCQAIPKQPIEGGISSISYLLNPKPKARISTKVTVSRLRAETGTKSKRIK